MATATRIPDLEAHPSQKRPCYRYIRAADNVPAVGETEGNSQAIVKLFNPTGPQTWYIAEYDADTREAFGVVDLGPGFEPEMGYISMAEIVGLRCRFGLAVERDLHWAPRPLAELVA